MRLIKKEVKMDPNTFSPVIQVTVELPLELMQDGIALMGEDEVVEMLGSELYYILRDK